MMQAPIAQLESVPHYESGGGELKSSSLRHSVSLFCVIG